MGYPDTRALFSHERAFASLHGLPALPCLMLAECLQRGKHLFIEFTITYTDGLILTLGQMSQLNVSFTDFFKSI